MSGEPTDAQMEGYEFRRAGGAAPTGSQRDGQAADAAWGHDDAWANARNAIAAAKAHIAGEGR